MKSATEKTEIKKCIPCIKKDIMSKLLHCIKPSFLIHGIVLFLTYLLYFNLDLLFICI